MKKIVVHAGFHPEVRREYKGEHIYKVVRTREVKQMFPPPPSTVTYYLLDNGAWIKSLGGEKYVTDWTTEERWGRVEEIETDEQGKVLSARDLGFMILRVDRANGLL